MLSASAADSKGCHRCFVVVFCLLVFGVLSDGQPHSQSADGQGSPFLGYVVMYFFCVVIGDHCFSCGRRRVEHIRDTEIDEVGSAASASDEHCDLEAQDALPAGPSTPLLRRQPSLARRPSRPEPRPQVRASRLAAYGDAEEEKSEWKNMQMEMHQGAHHEIQIDDRRVRDLWLLEDRLFPKATCELYPDLAQLPCHFRGLADQLRRLTIADTMFSSGEHPCLQRHQVEARKLCSEVCRDFLAKDQKSQEALLVRVPLRTVSDLLSQLQGQLKNNEAFSEAIQGPKLCSMLQEILTAYPDGMFQSETEELASQARTYVQDMWEKLHKDANSAAVLMDNFNQDEERLIKGVRSDSNLLSTDECFPDRCKSEAKRTTSMIRLMEMYLAKLDAVLGRDSMEANLSSACKQFSREHSASQTFRKELQEKHEGLACLAAGRMVKLDKLLAGEEQLLAKLNADAEESAMATKTTLTELMDTVAQALYKTRVVIAADMAVRTKRNHAKYRVGALRKEIATRGVPILAGSKHMHERLAERYTEAFNFKENIAEWLNTAYKGMSVKTQMTLDELRSNLPDDLAKLRQIAEAAEADLKEQNGRLQSAHICTMHRIQQTQMELEYSQYSGVHEAEFKRKQEDHKRNEDAKHWQEKQMSELQSKQKQVADTESCYLSKVQSPELLGVGWIDTSLCTAKQPSIPDNWVLQFFFSHRRSVMDFAGLPQHCRPAISGDSELDWENLSSPASICSASEARRSATSAPASRVFNNCLVDTASLLDPKGQPVPVASLSKGSALVNGVTLGSAVPIKPSQCHDLVVVETEEGATYCLTSDHQVAARKTGVNEWSPVAACQLLGMDVMTYEGTARVTSARMETRMCEVTKLTLDPENSVAFLASEGEFGSGPALAIFGEAPSDRLIRIDRVRGAIDSVPGTGSAGSAAAPSALSDPGPAGAPPAGLAGLAVCRPVLAQPAGLAVVTGEDPSEGSRGHPSSCAGACKYAAARCKFGVGCKRCHVPGCTRRESQKQRKQRSGTAEAPAAGAAEAPA